MARRKKHEEHENHERWLVSYADFITLLFAFFVVMYAISSVNQGKYRVLSDSLVAAFKEPKKSFEPIQIGEVVKSATNASIEIISRPTLIRVPIISLMNQETDSGQMPGAGITASPENARDIQKIAEEVALAMQKLVDLGLVSITMTDLWVEVEIKDSVLFPSGSAVIRQEAVGALTAIAAILADFTNPIRVEGFTDNVPISRLYPSNWELSAARAASVVRLFERLRIDSTRLSAVGYGEHRPIAPNDTADGRAKNRRVVLVVLADKQVEYLLEERLRHGAATREVPAAPGAAGQMPRPAPVPAPPPDAAAVAPAVAPAPVVPSLTPAAATTRNPADRRASTVPAAAVPTAGQDGEPPNPRPPAAVSLLTSPLELAPPATQPHLEPALPLDLSGTGNPDRPPAAQSVRRPP